MTVLNAGSAETACARLSRRLVEAADTARVESDPTRAAARVVGAQVVMGLDSHWEAAAAAPTGPIDVIDVFSGCGGMSAGFRVVNGLLPAFRIALAVDIDDVANRTYADNLQVEPCNEDVSRLDKDHRAIDALLAESERRHGHPLVLIGCAPCQGFSSHRNGTGLGDRRNSLFGAFARVACELEPDVIVVENVPELLTDRNWSHVNDARVTLERAGYVVHLSVHNAAEFGVPQERFRALMLASRKPFAGLRGFLTRSQFRTVRDAIGDLRPIAAGDVHPDDPMHYTARHRESTLEVIRSVPVDGGSRPPGVGPECLRRAERRQGKPAYEDVYGRLAWDRPAVTITNYARNPASGRFVHPEQDRGLSVREGALLQSFPSDYTFAGGLDPAFRQLGNAVPPAFAAYVACHVLGELLADSKPGATPQGIVEPLGQSFSRLIPALKAGNRSLA